MTTPSPHAILDACCRVFGATREELTRRGRPPHRLWQAHRVLAVAMRMANMTMEAIAAFTGQTSHTVTMHRLAVSTDEDRMLADDVLAEAINGPPRVFPEPLRLHERWRWDEKRKRMQCVGTVMLTQDQMQ